MQSAPTWQFFPVGVRETEKQRSRFQKLLMKLHLFPRSSTSIGKERIPVFYGENTHVEYIKRIKQLAEEPNKETV